MKAHVTNDASGKKLLFLAILVGLSVLLSLGIGEVMFRVMNLAPEVKRIPLDGFETAYRRSDNPVLGFELIPGYTNAHADFSITFPRINSHGQRDVEHSLEKPPGVKRIAVMGDSVVEGLGIRSLDEMLTRQLAALFNPDDTEVLAFGVSGYNTRAEVELLKTKALAFDPDLVVFVFVSNDFDNYVHDAVPLADGGERSAWIDGLFRRSSLFRRLSLNYDWFGLRREHDPLGWNRDAIGDNNVADALQLLSEIRQENGFEVLFGIWPRFAKFDIAYKHWLDESKDTLIIEDLCRTLGLRTFRFEPHFRKDWQANHAGSNPSALYTVGDEMHPNPRGCLVAAQALYGEVQPILAGVAPEISPPGVIASNAARKRAFAAGESRKPDDLSVRYHQGMRFFAKGDYEQALEIFDAVLQEDPTYKDAVIDAADSHHYLAEQAWRRGDKTEAEIRWRRALDTNPGHYVAALQLGRIRLEQGNQAQAVQLLDQALEAKPDYPEAQRALQHAKQRLPDTEADLP